MCPPNTDVTIFAIYKCHSSVAGVGRRAGAEPQRSAAPDRRPIVRSSQPHPFLPSEHPLARLVEDLAELEETRVALIAPPWPAALLGPATQLFITDHR
jgi:hypothetical protein